MEIVNFTPHALNIHDEAGDLVANIPPCGAVARLTTERVLVGHVGDIPIFKTVLGEVMNLPSPHPEVIYVVSGFVRSAVQRHDLYQPGELLRDAEGRVVGCVGLSQ